MRYYDEFGYEIDPSNEESMEDDFIYNEFGERLERNTRYKTYEEECEEFQNWIDEHCN